MRNPPPKLACFALLWLVAASSTARDDTIERDWPHTGHGSVTIDNAFGSITVIGWSNPRVQLRGDIGSRGRLTMRSETETRLHIAVVADTSTTPRAPGPPTVESGDMEARLVLQVPHAVALTVTSISADVQVNGMRRAPIVAISTVSGDQEIDVNVRRARLKSISGDIHLRGAAPRATLSVISGDVRLRDFAGGATISTVSGTLRIADASLGVLDIDSVSGDVRIAGAPAHHALWNIESLGGDIDLALPSLDRIAIVGNSFAGSIGHPVATAQRGSAGTGKRLEFRPARREARVRFETFSGDVNIRAVP